MKHFTLPSLIILMLVSTVGFSQKLETVEGDLQAIDTAGRVSCEFYYRGITIGEFVTEELFLRANKAQPDYTRAYLSGRDSLNARAFLAGFKSEADSSLPELTGDDRQVPLHLIVKTVHWEPSADLSAADELVLEYILLANPGRRLQHGRYYMRKVIGIRGKTHLEKLTAAYFQAGVAMASALKEYTWQPEDD